MRYSIDPRHQIFVKGYGFLFSAENMDSKYGQKLLDTTKNLAIHALKTVLKRLIQEVAEATGDLVGNKIAGNITKAASKSERIQKNLCKCHNQQRCLRKYTIRKVTTNYS